MSFAKFYLKLGPTRSKDNSVIINGEDVTQFIKNLVVMGPGTDEVTKLHLELYADGEIEGEGIVHVSKMGQPSPILALLLAMDPEDLEKKALERLEWGSNQSVVANALEIIKELIRGNQSPGS